MINQQVQFPLRTGVRRATGLSFATLLATVALQAAVHASPVPGYVPPVRLTETPVYADDTRGVYVDSHVQHRLSTGWELGNWGSLADSDRPMDNPQNHMKYLADGTTSIGNELDRIASGAPATLPPVTQPQVMAQANMAPTYAAPYTATSGYGSDYGYGTAPAPVQQAPMVPAPVQQQYQPQIQQPMQQPAQQPVQSAPQAMPGYANMNPYAAGYPEMPAVNGGGNPRQTTDGGQELLVGTVAKPQVVDMHNSVVQLREDRISVRNALQRMMDQIGAGTWTIVWDLAEQNANLPDMEISIYAEEPFLNVMNALLARIQTRSGQPLRVIRYDGTQRLVLTDRSGTYRLPGEAGGVTRADTDGSEPAVTERVLKEAKVSLHYDEVPLVDALENIVNQAGRGQWRLRMYAGMDQVLKPAHIEEPFNVALERLLKVFNLKYEIFPGGKLIVVTHNNRFGFEGTRTQ